MPLHARSTLNDDSCNSRRSSIRNTGDPNTCTAGDSSAGPTNTTFRVRLPWELIEAILVAVAVAHYPPTRDEVRYVPSVADAKTEHELRQYLFVARGLPRAHRAIVLRFPGCTVPCAVSDGRIDRLNVHAAVDPTLAIQTKQLGSAMRQVARRGDTAVLQWLHARADAWKLRDLVQSSTATALIAAAKRNDVDFGEFWVTSMVPDARSVVRAAMVEAVDAAVRFGHTDMLAWWVQQAFPVAKHTARFARTASAHGQINVLEWIARAPLPIEQCHDAMDAACANGHVDVLEWWCAAHARGSMLKLPFQVPLIKASANGHVHVLDWWWRRFGGVISAKDRDYGAVTASQYSRLAALDWWLADKSRWSSGSVPVMTVALKRALYGNQVAVLDKWKRLVESHAARADQRPSSVPPLSWWADCGYRVPTAICSTMADFTIASQNGCIDAMRWWTAHKLPYVHSPDAIDCACQTGNVAVLDWWRHESGVEPLYTAAALANASRHGRMEVLEWWERSGLPLKYTKYTWREGIESELDGVANWWRRSNLPPSAPIDGDYLPRFINAIESAMDWQSMA